MSVQTVAAFDFDGTITDRDSLLPFLFYNKGLIKTVAYLITLLPYLLGFVLKLVSRQRTKEAILTRFFKGISLEEQRQWGKRYATEKLNQFVKPAALERIKWHQAQGHMLILISASLDFYLHAWAEQNGFDALICSHLEVDEQGRMTGKLAGLNCWGLEKQRRLLEKLGRRESFILYAYGDSRGDQELLAMADHPFYRFF
jgi:phosphatidylglycerophosphatase C